MARTDSSPDGGSVWTSPTFLASGALVALVVVLAAVLALSGGKDDPAAPSGTAPVASTPAGAPTEATQAPESPTDPKSDSVCGLPAGSQDVPTEAPSTKWELVGKVAAPTARKSFGPGKIASNGLRSCYAHSPVGALYAAANLTVMTTSGPALRRAAIDQLVKAGAARRRAKADLVRDASNDGTPEAVFQVAGYAFRTYEDSSALVDVAMRITTTATSGADVTGLVHLPVSLVWTDGDWRATTAPDGSFIEGGRISGLDGYVEWSGA